MVKSAVAGEASPTSVADQAMERYADGDETAFATLYDQVAPRLYRLCCPVKPGPAASHSPALSPVRSARRFRPGWSG